jgi:tetratricopeptide (TPR) repeat protein
VEGFGVVIWMHAAFLAWSVVVPAVVVPVVPVAPMPRPDQIMTVPPELLAQLQQQVLVPDASRRSRADRLAKFLFQTPGLGLQYSADATSTVEQAYQTRKANCLTYTLLTVALARASGLHAYAQELDNIVAWRIDDDLIYGSNHVNAVIDIGNLRFTVDVARDRINTRYVPQPISDQRLLALYYNNRAAELLATAPPAVVAPYMAMALQLAPNYASAWANAGVLAMRLGDAHEAERDELKALTLDASNASALVNLVTLYRNNGDDARRAIYERRIDEIRVKDPYFQFMQAEDNAKQGDYAGAVKHYWQAIRLYDGDARFYLGLAYAYQQLGEDRHARRAMKRAALLGHDGTGDKS